MRRGRRPVIRQKIEEILGLGTKTASETNETDKEFRLENQEKMTLAGGESTL